MLRRLLHVAVGPRQEFSVDDGGSGHLYVRCRTDPVTVVLPLGPRDVERLVVALNDWLDCSVLNSRPRR